MEPQNSSNSSDIACTSKMKRGKNYEKKEREKKRVMKGLAGMSLANLDQECSDHSSDQTKKARESSDSAKWNEGVLHLVSVQEPLLTTLKELNYNPYAGYCRVQFQKNKSAKQFQNLETSSRSPKGDENL